MGETPQYVNPDGSSTEVAKKVGDCFDVSSETEACKAKRTELKNTVSNNLPKKTDLNLKPTKVSDTGKTTLFAVLMKTMPNGMLNDPKHAELAYGYLTKQVNKQGLGNVDLLLADDTVQVVGGKVKVTRAAGSKALSWEADLYPWPNDAGSNTSTTADKNAAEEAAKEKQVWQEWVNDVVEIYKNTPLEPMAAYTKTPFRDNGKGGILFAKLSTLDADPLVANLADRTAEKRAQVVNALNARWKQTH